MKAYGRIKKRRRFEVEGLNSDLKERGLQVGMACSGKAE